MNQNTENMSLEEALVYVYTAPTAHFARYFCPLVPLLPTDVPNTHKHNFIV